MVLAAVAGCAALAVCLLTNPVGSGREEKGMENVCLPGILKPAVMMMRQGRTSEKAEMTKQEQVSKFFYIHLQYSVVVRRLKNHLSK